MNKKLAMIGAGVVAGSVLLMSSVYAGIGKAPGYEAFKSAVKNTAAVDNATKKVDVSIEDNGNVLFQVNAVVKTDRATQASSAEINLLSDNAEQSIQMFNQEGKNIIHANQSDVYQIVNADAVDQELNKQHSNRMEQHGPAFAEEAENVIDALVGNLKDYVTLKEDGASKEIGLQLTGSQIPAIVNTVGSLLIRESGRHHGEEPELNPADTFGVNVQSIKDSLPKLAEDIKIETVSLETDVNADNLITSYDAEIRISGKDDQGNDHAVVVKLNLGLTDFNSSTPDTVDLAGKQTINVESFQGKGFQGWHKQ